MSVRSRKRAARSLAGPSDAERRAANQGTRRSTTPRKVRPTIASVAEGKPAFTERRTASGDYNQRAARTALFQSVAVNRPTALQEAYRTLDPSGLGSRLGLEHSRAEKQAALRIVLENQRQERALEEATKPDDSILGRFDRGGLLGVIDKDARDVVTKAIYGSEHPSLKQNVTTAGLGAVGGVAGKAAGAAVARAVPAIADTGAGLVIAARGARLLGKSARVAGNAIERVPHPIRAAGSLAGSVAGRAAAPVTSRLAASAPGRAGGALASRALATPAGRAAAGAGRVGKYFVTRPVRTTLGAGVGLEALPGGDQKANIEGQGRLAGIGGGVGNVVGGALPGIAGNAVKDAFTLPSQVVPSLYLPAAGAFEAAKGRPQRIEKLWSDYTQGVINPETGEHEGKGLIPALVEGDFNAASDAAQNHPLFSALEASGAYAVAGRGAGAAARSGALGKGAREAASTKRAPLNAYGYEASPRDYSKNLFTKGLQKREEAIVRNKGQRFSTGSLDIHRNPNFRDPNQMTPHRITQHLKGAPIEGARHGAYGVVNRMASHAEQVRRQGQAEAIKRRIDSKPRYNHDLTFDVVQGVIRSPETFHADIGKRMAQIQKALADDGPDALKGTERKHATAQLKSLAKGLDLDPKGTKVKALFDDAHDYIEHLGPLEKAANDFGLIPESDTARILPYAQTHHGAAGIDHPAEIKAQIAEARAAGDSESAARLAAEHPETIVDEHGRPMDLEKLNAAAKEDLAHGDVPGFVSQRSRGRGSYYQPNDTRGAGVGGARRSGRAFARGAYDSSHQALTEHLLHIQTIGHRARSFDAMIARFAHGKPGGQGNTTFFNHWGEAQAAAENPAAYGIEAHGIKLVPIRLAPMRAKLKQLESARSGDHAPADLLSEEGILNEAPEMRQRISTALESALEPGSGKGQIALIPEDVVTTLREQNAPARGADKILQSATQSFKNTVLPFSTKWTLGNTFEVEMRSLFHGLGLGQPGTSLGKRRLSKRYLDAYEAQHGKAARNEFEGSLISGSHLSSVAQQKVFREGSHAASRAFQEFTSRPGPKQLHGLYAKARDLSFAANGWLERQPQYAALGKAVQHEVNQNIGRYQHALRVGDDAIAELVKNDGHNFAAREKYARSFEDIFGNWNNNSAAARHMLLTYAPFYMWARAASRFVLVSMPRNHPVKTALIAAAEEMTEPERKKLGLDLFTSDRVPGFLQGGIPGGPKSDTGVQGILPTGGFSSFGYFSNYPDALAGVMLPQFSSTLNTLQGMSWKGTQLTLPDGSQPNQLQLTGLAGYTQLEAMLPALGIARRIGEGGGTSEDYSFAGFPRTKPTNPGTGPAGGAGRVFGLRFQSPQAVAYLRTLPRSRQINVPLTGGSSGGSSSSGGANHYSTIAKPGGGGGTSSNPYSTIAK